MNKLLIILLVMQAAGSCAAQDTLNFPPPAFAPTVYASETTENIFIDGKLEETAWCKAPVIRDFFRIEPRQGGGYLYQTFVKIIFDKRNLYFGIYCKDSMGKAGVRVQDLKRDFEFGENDIFFLQLDPQNLKRFCVSFQTTPYGNQRDLQAFDDTNRDNEWDALWKVRTTITNSGWFAEFAIPFKSLRYEIPKGSDSVSWGLTLSRLARRDYEQTVFPAIPQSFSPYRMSYAAQLKGLQLPAPSANIRMQPYSLFQSGKSTNSAGTTTRKSLFKTGGEIKWAITPRTVLDVTFNTDFAQADVDRAVNNLTRFNIFFPERRQFFLESSGVYAGADITNVKPFFSRTIGLANDQFNADPVPVDAGVRYTDRNQKRTVAGLYVHQRSTGGEAAANFGVLRYLKNYRQQNNIGVMLTHRLDEMDVSKGFQQRNNSTITIDGFIRPKDDITIQYLGSVARDNSNDSIGFAGSFYTSWSPNKGYLHFWTDFVSDKYVPGMGYIFAGNTLRSNTGGYYIWRPQHTMGKLIRRWDPGVFFTSFHTISDGRFQSAEIDVFPVWIYFRNNSSLLVDVFFNWEQFFFMPLGIQVNPGKYFFASIYPRYSTDASKKLSASIGLQAGNYYDGTKKEITASVRIAPVPHIAFTADYAAVSIRSLGIANTNLDYAITTLGARLAANPQIQATCFYQYNSFTKQGRWNIRGSWEFSPLSFLYIVFNESSFTNNPVKNQSFISKLTYLKQF